MFLPHYILLLLLLLLSVTHLPPAHGQNSAIEALVADHNEDHQQFNPADTDVLEPKVQISNLQRPPSPTRPEFIEGMATSTTLTARWKGTWSTSIGNYPVTAFELQYRPVGAPTWITATSFRGTGHEIGKFHHEIQTVTSRANSGQRIEEGWFRLTLHARGMNDADPESRTQTVRIPYNATAEQFKVALDSLDNLRFAGTTKHVTRSETPDAQGGYTWTVSFDVGSIGMFEDTARLEDGRLSDATFPLDSYRNWPSLLVTETYFPQATWTGGGKHVTVGTARVGTGGGGSGSSTVSLEEGFRGTLADGQAGLAACAHAGHVGTATSSHPFSKSVGTHAGVEGPSYDHLTMAFPPSFCQLSIMSLRPYSSFQLRVRARNVHGWGPYSEVTDPVGRTLRGFPPSRPTAPTLSSATGNVMTVLSLSGSGGGSEGKSVWNGGAPLLSWDFQIKYVSSAAGGIDVGDAGDARGASMNYHRRMTGETVQGYRWRDIYPSVSRGGLRRPLQQSPERGGSITAENLTPMTTYVFRTRAVNEHGAGPWSMSSVPMTTTFGIPNIPTIPVAASQKSSLEENGVGDTWMEIGFSYEYDDVVDGPSSGSSGSSGSVGLSNGAVITRFEVESLDLTNLHSSEWSTAGSILIQTEGGRTTYRNEVQTISTRCDAGATISDGWFQLGFNHGGRTTADPESNVVTSRLRYDATAKEVKDALERLGNIGLNGILRVERNVGLESSELFETGGRAQVLQSGVGSEGTGGYRWTVVFDSTASGGSTGGSTGGRLSGDLPMLVVIGEGMTASWTGGGRRVNVVETVKGGRRELVQSFNERGEDAPAPLSKDDPLVLGREGRTTSKAHYAVENDGDDGDDDGGQHHHAPLSLVVRELKSYTSYRFRVRAVSENFPDGSLTPTVSISPWSAPSRPLRTKATPRPWLVRQPTSTSGVIMLTGNGRETINTADPSFSFGVGRGGRGLEPGVGASTLSRAAKGGSGGLIVITCYIYGQEEVPSSTFHYTGGEQLYVVPKSTVQGQTVAFVQIKTWGAGGGSGCGKQGSLSQIPSSNHSQGGGGGFAQATLEAAAGDLLRVRVGGGGGGCDGGKGGVGGWNGGGDGGGGDYGAGGGGGASDVWRIAAKGDRVDVSGRERSDERTTSSKSSKSSKSSSSSKNDVLLVVAGGGGGGGTTDYCCGHGGAGGGRKAEDGVASTLTTPRNNNPNEGTDVLRREFTSIVASEQNPPRMDPRDATGLPAFHQHTDAGLAPEADLKVLALPGGGGEQGEGGAAGSSGSWAYSLSGEIYPIHGRDVTGVVGAVAAESTAGRRGQGGRGAWGKEGGGGGGGGYVGGGGGGSGVDGAGGGGGSGYVNLACVYDSELVRSLEIHPNAPSAPVVMRVNESSATIRWAPPRDSYLRSGAEPVMYYVEMSIGPSSQEFVVAYRRPGAGMVGFDGSVEARNYGPLVYTAVGLESERTYRFRVRAKSRAVGVGPPSEPVSVTTTGKVENVWHRVRPRPLAQAQAGGGRRLHDPPTSEKPLAPSPRRGHTAVVLGGFMYVFGGRQDGYPCDVASTNTNRRGL